jgi:hypothetical protein
MDLTTGDLHMEACLPVAMIREGKWSLSSIMALRLTPVLGELGGRRILGDLPSMRQENPAANAIAFVTRVGTKVVKGVWIPKLARISMYMQLN